MGSRWVVIGVLLLWGQAFGGEVPEDGKAPADDSKAAQVRKLPGFVDENRDGVNDLFADREGDGVNDVSGAPYPHGFGFADSDENGVNDLFVDRDGDGVNDLDARVADRNGDGLCDNVIDAEGDGVNDITGLAYGPASLNGFRYGFVDEEHGVAHGPFIDENGDGMQDRGRGRAGAGRRMDRFVDEDGDGICDGRTVRGRAKAGRKVQRRGGAR